jgi:hypothetical protein
MCEDYRKGRLPRPDLNNLSHYLEAGINFDHEMTEMQTVADYEGMYRDALTKLHWGRPIPSDKRLWRPADIVRAEKLLISPEPASKVAAIAKPSTSARSKPVQKKRAAGRR